MGQDPARPIGVRSSNIPSQVTTVQYLPSQQLSLRESHGKN